MQIHDKIYGIDYDIYVCDGYSGVKLDKISNNTLIFNNEYDMLQTLAELKTNNHIGNVKPFVASIQREEYIINKRR